MWMGATQSGGATRARDPTDISSVGMSLAMMQMRPDGLCLRTRVPARPATNSVASRASVHPRGLSRRTPSSICNRPSIVTEACSDSQAQQRACDSLATSSSIDVPCCVASSSPPWPIFAAGLAVLSASLVPEAHAAVAPVLGELAGLDAGQAARLEALLRPVFALYTLLYIVRIPMTWYPNIKTKELPWALVAFPTDPFLSVARKVVPLVGGVDVTPIVLVGLISFANEIFLGPQGILMLIQRQSGAPL